MKTAPVHYAITAPHPHQHLWHVTLTISQPQAEQMVMLPVWIPGSYLNREYAKHRQALRAQQGNKPCAVQQLDKHRWRIACQSGKPLQLRYQVYAHDPSVRTAWLDAQRGFFNATSLCLMVDGQTDAPHHLSVAPPHTDWELATGLTPVQVDHNGFGLYAAANYDELADCPVEMGRFWSATFEACGVPHRFVVTNPPPAFDGQRLLADTQRICEAEMRFWHGARPHKKIPFSRYVFLLHAVDDGYGGLEHRNSTALIASRKHLPRIGQPPPDDYTTFLGLVSHEYFHTWNVKRLTPAAFVPYDYAQENYTELLWFFEGLTSYYDDLLLLRANCIDFAGYLKQLQKTLDNVRASPGRHIHSAAQSSLEAWTKYYRPDENTPNATVSYYTQGALVGLCLDLTLRQEGRTTLDAVLQTLYQRCYAQAPVGMTERDLADVLQQLGGRSFAKELRAWVHGTDELPVEPLLQAFGVQIEKTPAPLAQQWGLRVQEGSSIAVQTVLRGGVAEAAGLAAGDEWLGVEIASACPATHTAWRVGSLQDVQNCLPPLPPTPSAKGKRPARAQAPTCIALVARDKRLLRLPMTLPAQPLMHWKLAQAPSAKKTTAPKPGWPWR